MSLQILAPAGNRESLEAAVAAGADEIYLGYSLFSARAGATNFDAGALRDAARFAHFYHVRVVVALNTLIKDSEWDEALEALRTVYACGADAVLIQDAGLLNAARRMFPDLAIYASTQMAIHNAAGARWCADQGIRRVVLARECSLDEIRLAAAEGIEAEVFCHGAQCVSVSGECLFSSMAGGRSGNRGRCAQPCRKRYFWRGVPGAWLSPRDICLRDDLPEIEKAGVSAIKIEGRLKRPEYVAIVTGAYRKAIDAMRAGSFEKSDETERTALLQAFHRGGFMKGYAGGSEDAGVIAPERGGAGGVRIGRVVRSRPGRAEIELGSALHNGDGLEIRGSGGDTGIIYSGPEIAAGGAAVIRLRPGEEVSVGDSVFRLTDARQMAGAVPELPEIQVDMELTAYPGQRLKLLASDGCSETVCEGPEVEPAATRPADEQSIINQLTKTGGTGFCLNKARVRTANAFVPVSVINEIRRRALEELREARIRAFAGERGGEAEINAFDEPMIRNGPEPDTAVCRTVGQARALEGSGLRLVWYPEDFRTESLCRELSELPRGVWLRLPTVCEEGTLAALAGFVDENKNRIGGVVIGSIGQLGVRWAVPVGASEDVPVMNRHTAAFLFKQGCVFITASQELTGGEVRTLVRAGEPVLVPAWGRTQMLLLHHCPARTALGLKQGHAGCSMCDENRPESLRGGSLTDEAGRSFPCERIRLPEGCAVRLMNERPTDLRKETAGFARLFMFDEESGEKALEIVSGAAADQEITRGHWRRETQ